MKNIKLLALSSSLLCLSIPTQVFAQEEEESTFSLEEVVITGRKREETLQEIPVSASVMSDALIQDAGITDLHDLFGLIPGLHYDEGGDRLAALPSIRGIQANDVASNRTKVTAFIDGMPVLGSQGSIGFNGFDQVEVYRGPQSAAFGRSTFAGAINYVTSDPGPEFGGDIGVDISDYGTRVVSGSLNVPVSDTIGFLLNASVEDSDSPSEYHAIGNHGTDLFGLGQNQEQSDGTEFGARAGVNLSGKLVFEPSDDLKVSMTFTHVETDDQQAPSLYLTEEARNQCLNGSGFFASEGMMAPYLVGEMDCDWDNYRSSYGQHDIEKFIESNPDYLNYLTTRAEGAGAAAQTIDGTTYSVEEQLLLMAKAFSIPEDDRGTESDRNRFTLQVDKVLANDHALQFSFMKSEETFQRASSNAFMFYDPDYIGIVDDGNPQTFGDAAFGPEILWTPGATGDYWAVQQGMAWPTHATPSTGEIDETYAEVRWVSPGDERFRYVVGASYYQYDFLEERWGAGGPGVVPVAYGAQLNGIVPEYLELSGHNDRGTVYGPDDAILGEDASNSAIYFNLGYDITEKLTFSLEGRYQADEVGATNVNTGLSEEVTTKKFVPRVSFTYNATDESSYYIQWAKGVNPAGINVDVLTEDTLNVLTNGVANGLIPFTDAQNTDDNADLVVDAYNAIEEVWYTDGTQTTLASGDTYSSGFSKEDFTSFGEEEITQFEIGFKGSLMDGRLSYAGAVYMIEWTDQIQNGSIDLDSPCADNGEVGNIVGSVDLTEACSYLGQDYLYVGTAEGATLNAALNFGDVSIKGIEIEGNYRISDHWDVRAQASVLEAKYDDFCDIAAYGATELDPNDAVDAGYLDEFNIRIREPGDGDSLTSTCYVTDGNDVAGQPKVSASISPSYSTNIGSLRFNTRLDISYEGSQFENSINYNSYPAVTLANLSFGLSSEQWSATLYVNNLFDDNSPRRISGGGDNTRQIGLIGQDADLVLLGHRGEDIPNSDITRDNFNFEPRAPRTIGLRANYNF